VASAVPYDRLFGGTVRPAPFDAASVGEFLRCSLGLSAWKRYGRSRWALRVNPSSGNLHPTEGYVLWRGGVHHYAPEVHALEERCTVGGDWGNRELLVGLTSILWREAWKYGERAFRYCQHDLGHAIAAVRLAAALAGWRAVMLPAWPQREIGSLVGLDRDEDFADAEREEPACVLALFADSGLSTDDRRLTTDDRRLTTDDRRLTTVD
jgi:SagB-type dehydrogenase family enzyme